MEKVSVMENPVTEDVINSEQMDMLITSAGVDTAKAILDAFWKSNDEIVAALATHLSANDFKEASASAHALKGSAANLGAMRLSNRARDIEVACRDSNCAGAKELLEKVRTDIVATRRAFDGLLVSNAA